MKKWTIEESQTLIQDKWIHLRRDSVITADGSRLSPYYVYVNCDWAAVVAFSKDHHILLQRQYRHGIQEFIWEIPGGSLDEGESAEAGAAREFLEETGCQGTRLEKLTSLVQNPTSQTNRAHFFVAHDVVKIQEPHWEIGEEMEFAWLSVPELLALIDAGEFIQGIHLGAIFLALRKYKLL